MTVGPGVVVADVIPDTPAQEAGLLRDDLIDAVNGKPVTSGEELRNLIQELPEGAEVTLRVTRGGNTQDLKVVLDGVAEAD